MGARRYGLVAGLGALVLALDQVSKVWVLGALSAVRPAIEATPFLNIVLVWNRGISFGLFNRDSDWQPWLLVGLTLVIVAGLMIWLRTVRDRWTTLAIGLIAGGATGNAIEPGALWRRGRFRRFPCRRMAFRHLQRRRRRDHLRRGNRAGCFLVRRPEKLYIAERFCRRSASANRSEGED